MLSSHIARRFSSCSVLFVLSLMSLSRPEVARAADQVDVRWSELRDVNGEPLTMRDAKWTVACFLGTECPLARLYGPRLQRLAAEYSKRGVRLIGIHGNLQDSTDDIRQYAAEHELAFPMIKDADQSLARKFGATRTPEVFVLDAAGRIRYHGRIDDQYEPGISRPRPARHDLRDAIEALTTGREDFPRETTAVGCLITFVEPAPPPIASADSITFHRDVAPVLNRHCVECHREGEIGPFALTDYDEVVGWAEMMLEVIDQGRMPPWHADPRHGEFVGARRIPDRERAVLAAWVEQGLAEGDRRDRPPAPEWAGKGWHLSAPDVEFRMRDRPFVVPREGTVEYQYFVVDPGWETDRWVRAAQVVPGESSVVHHAIVFVRPPDGAETEGIGWLGGYVPGQRVRPYPAGHARRVPAGSKLVFQMHYTPNGREAEDVSKVGVWFADPDDVTHEVTTRVALNHHFEIPPGARDHVVRLRLDGFARESRLLGAMPHMHLRGRSFRLEASRDERRETLLHVPRYDFNWQHWYRFVDPPTLDEIDSLEMEVRFDNSASNPTNPAPDEYVTWGDQTWQEMAVAFFDIADPRGKPRIVQRKPERASPEDEARRKRRIQRETEEFLSRLDRDGDGVVRRDETPDAFRRFGFGRMDHDGNGRLDRREIEIEAARRF